ncbi:UDP-N-acetylenolpyruvoylglucosamine reductase [Candidatus Falkowbacteria bacterium RIFCSPLOWO2_02_FULL_45_21]|uniref:UDP-N-acetylenolpyruvoylglucosamine reductase n=1 Tax=Candidatus Falkowbacteria bacterium RIFCSPLOWO2_02_FULL_45_21 TaxID=1797989 RepID=A0A1F5SD65_9BACT|nr:MAG: UDP-N-acetylenolpyruvoylglucosamine reductase [Candidatus Falkowbacteria bacterium RIFCSPLOWO2_02_FULL_45_21]
MSLEKRIKKNYDLTSLTTIKIGGRAEYFVLVKNKRELIEAVNWAKTKKLPSLFLAGGSNTLITKKKIGGLVIKISGENYTVKGNIMSAWAGTGLTRLAQIAFDHGLSGLEWALGVPGSLGGAVRGNAGAYGSDISEQVSEVEAYDAVKGRVVRLSHRACAFSYRHSVFKERRNLYIVNVRLKLSQGQAAEITNSAKKNLRSRIKTNPKEPSAGCIFKNLEYKKLIKENYRLAEDLSAQRLFRGGKIGAAYLIDQLGLKGRARGGAKISERHANFIVNSGGATAQDVMNLISLIKKKVKARYKINLEEEVQYFGN